MFRRRQDLKNTPAPPIANPLPSPPPEARNLNVVDARLLEEWYSAALRQRVGDLTETLGAEIVTDLMSRFDEELRCKVENVSYRWESTADSLKREITNIGHRLRIHDRIEEIRRTEKLIGEIEVQLEKSFTDDSVPLSKLLQLRTTQTDLKSYLRGLKFGYSATSAPDGTRHPQTSGQM